MLAQFPPSQDIAPAIMGVLVFMIPIVAILTRHQREMAKLIHGQDDRRVDVSPQVADRIASLEREVVELKDLVRRQLIAVDDLKSTPPNLVSGQEDLSSRVGGA